MDGCFGVVQPDVPCLTYVLKAIQVVGMVFFSFSLSDCTSNHNDVVCDTNNYLQPYRRLSEAFLGNLTAY